MGKKNCYQHPENLLDRICISDSCSKPDKIICDECADEHAGKVVRIDSLLVQIRQFFQNNIDNKLPDVEVKNLNCSFRQRFKNIQMKLQNGLEKIEEKISQQVQYIERSNSSSEVFQDILELKNLKYDDIYLKQQIQNRLIEIEFLSRDRDEAVIPDFKQIQSSVIQFRKISESIMADFIVNFIEQPCQDLLLDLNSAAEINFNSNFISTHEISKQNFSSKKPVLCKIHSEKTVSFYCFREQCQEARKQICPTCVMEKQHIECIDKHQVADQESISSILSKLKEKYFRVFENSQIQLTNQDRTSLSTQIFEIQQEFVHTLSKLESEINLTSISDDLCLQLNDCRRNLEIFLQEGPTCLFTENQHNETYNKLIKLLNNSEGIYTEADQVLSEIEKFQNQLKINQQDLQTIIQGDIKELLGQLRDACLSLKESQVIQTQSINKVEKLQEKTPENKKEEENLETIHKYNVVTEIKEIYSEGNANFHMLEISKNQIIVVHQENLICLVDVSSGINKRKFKCSSSVYKDCMFVISEQFFGTRTIDGQINIFQINYQEPIKVVDLNELTTEKFNNSLIYINKINLLAVAFKTKDRRYTLKPFKVLFDEANQQITEINIEFKGQLCDQIFNCLQKLDDERFISGSDDQKLMIWDTKNFQTKLIQQQTSSVTRIKTYINNTIVYGCFNGEIVIFDFIQNLENIRIYSSPNINKKIDTENFYSFSVLSQHQILITQDHNEKSVEILDLNSLQVQVLDSSLDSCHAVSSIFMKGASNAIVILTWENLKILQIN